MLCHAADEAAIWAYEELGRRGLPVSLITVEVLACALRWRHWLGAGAPRIEFDLADGRHIDSRFVRGALNRVQWVPPDNLAVAAPEERAYASQEFQAFFAGWLYSLPPPVLNPPTAQGLSGRWRHPTEWHWLAGQAGLPTLPLKITGHDHDLVTAAYAKPRPHERTVLVLCGEAIGGGLPSDFLAGCRHLSELAEIPLLGINFCASDDNTWIFAGADLHPDLRLGGPHFIDRLARVFQRVPGGLEDERP